MSGCECCHEDFCMLKETYEIKECKFQYFEEGCSIPKCKAKEEDLIDVYEYFEMLEKGDKDAKM